MTWLEYAWLNLSKNDPNDHIIQKCFNINYSTLTNLWNEQLLNKLGTQCFKDLFCILSIMIVLKTLLRERQLASDISGICEWAAGIDTPVMKMSQCVLQYVALCHRGFTGDMGQTCFKTLIHSHKITSKNVVWYTDWMLWLPWEVLTFSDHSAAFWLVHATGA